MTGFPAIAVVIGLAAVALGLPLSLYALLTRARRRTMQEIRRSASERSWEFHRPFMRGDPTEFDIRGRTQSALPWVLKCRGTTGYDRGWTVRLGLRLPTLAGETDLAILPRESGKLDIAALAAQASPEMLAHLAKVSATAAGAAEFFKNAQELRSGLPGFDGAYQVLVAKNYAHQALLDESLARRVTEWPAESVPAHSMLAWRDPFGLHFEARLPGPPNWLTIDYFLALAEQLIARVPPATAPTAPRGIADRIAENFLKS